GAGRPRRAGARAGWQRGWPAVSGGEGDEGDWPMAGRPAGLFACLAMAAALFVTIVLPAAARTGMDTAPASTVARSVDRVIVGYSPSTPAADKASIERAQGARLIPGSVRQSEGEGAVGLRPVSRTATTTDGSPRVMS